MLTSLEAAPFQCCARRSTAGHAARSSTQLLFRMADPLPASLCVLSVFVRSRSCTRPTTPIAFALCAIRVVTPRPRSSHPRTPVHDSPRHSVPASPARYRSPLSYASATLVLCLVPLCLRLRLTTTAAPPICLNLLQSAHYVYGDDCGFSHLATMCAFLAAVYLSSLTPFSLSRDAVHTSSSHQRPSRPPAVGASFASGPAYRADAHPAPAQARRGREASVPRQQHDRSSRRVASPRNSRRPSLEHARYIFASYSMRSRLTHSTQNRSVFRHVLALRRTACGPSPCHPCSTRTAIFRVTDTAQYLCTGFSLRKVPCRRAGQF